MIIPVRCVTCGMVLASKWRKYQELVADVSDSKLTDSKPTDPKPTDSKPTESKPSDSRSDGLVGPRHGAVLDSMGITKMCCRRHMLTNVDAMDRI